MIRTKATAGDYVKTAGFQTCHHGVPLCFFKFNFDAQFVGNCAGYFDIVAGQFAVFVVVGEWCVSAFRTDSDGTFIVDTLNQ